MGGNKADSVHSSSLCSLLIKRQDFPCHFDIPNMFACLCSALERRVNIFSIMLKIKTYGTGVLATGHLLDHF